MGTLLNRRRYMGGGGGSSPLPSGYTQILGVKNTSTAYLPAPTINAGVRYELEIAGHAVGGNTSVFGNNGSSNKEILVFFSNTTTCYLRGGFQVANFTKDQKYKIVIDLAMESEYARMYIDDVLVRQTSLNIDTGRDMQIFRDGSRGGAVYGTMYSFKGYVNNVLINDYIPAIRNSDRKVGVYDIASNEFITSPNGVDFIEP